MTPQRDPEFERTIAEMIRWLKPRGLIAVTRRGQALLIRPRPPRRSRLTGEAR